MPLRKPISRAPHILKLGGSLLDLPDLVDRFAALRRREVRSPALVVVGGGRAADTVRHFYRHNLLDETAGHWLAVRAMDFHAHLLAKVLPDAQLADSPAAAKRVWQQGSLAICQPLEWLGGAAQHGCDVPHRWQFTSDSIAAHLARQLGAARLTLLKSALPGPAATLADAADSGIVDACFPEVAGTLPCVEIVNLRDDHLPKHTFKPAGR